MGRPARSRRRAGGAVAWLAMPAPATASPEEIRDVNTRYHDGAAAQYDTKWGIDFGAVGRQQVLGKLRKALGPDLPVFDHALEIGAGTGYFSLHLLMAGVVRRVTCTDISPGMLDALRANARRLDLDVQAVACDAEDLPFADGTFDLVLGHAVLHHLPDLDRAFRELHRVLRPGGTAFFAGEPSRVGDRIATVPKRAAGWAAPAWRLLLNARPAAAGHSDGGEANHQLEGLVDVHAFVPDDLSRRAAARGASRGTPGRGRGGGAGPRGPGRGRSPPPGAAGARRRRRRSPPRDRAGRRWRAASGAFPARCPCT